MTKESYIQLDRDGKCSMFVGPLAMQYMRAETLASALKLYAACKIIPTRGMTITRMLGLASAITGNTYKRGAYVQAAEDVKANANEMKAALPVRAAEGV